MKHSAEELLDRLLSWALANRNTKHEFVTCYTYGAGRLPQVIVDAKRYFGESTDHIREVCPDEKRRGKAKKRAKVR